MTKSLLSAQLAAAGMDQPQGLGSHRSVSLPLIPSPAGTQNRTSPPATPASPLSLSSPNSSTPGRMRSRSHSATSDGSTSTSPKGSVPDNFRSRYYSALNVAGGKAAPMAVPPRSRGQDRHGHGDRHYAASAPLDIPSGFPSHASGPALASSHAPTCATFVRDPTTWGHSQRSGSTIVTPSSSWTPQFSTQRNTSEHTSSSPHWRAGMAAASLPGTDASSRSSSLSQTFVPPHELLGSAAGAGIDFRPVRRDEAGI